MEGEGELESAEQLRESLRESIGNSMRGSTDDSMAAAGGRQNSFSRMSYEDDDDDDDDNDNPLDVSMIDADAPASAADGVCAQ